jgi:Autophagy protein ATG9
MNNSAVHASNYLKQFPSPLISIIAKFISFVSGGFAAILIIIAFLDESLLEGQVSLQFRLFDSFLFLFFYFIFVIMKGRLDPGSIVLSK